MDLIDNLNLPGLPRIIFGLGTFAKLPEIIKDYGGQALIITGGESLKKSGRWTPLTVQLNREGIQFRALSIRGEPTAQAIDAIASEYRKNPVNVVVAIGGGSVIDCGKAVSAMLAGGGLVKNYLEGVGTKKPTGAKIPFVAVPPPPEREVRPRPMPFLPTGRKAIKNRCVMTPTCRMWRWWIPC